MLNQIAMLIVLCGLLLGSTARAQATSEPATDADKALASRFALLAQQILRDPAFVPARYDQAAALLQASHRLVPTEPRYLHLLAEAEKQCGNIQEAIDATSALARLEPQRRATYAQLVELYLLRMESVDAQVDYLQSVLGQEPLGEAVRSHAAARIAQLRLEQGAHQLAEKMVDQALQWNPVNPLAARINWALVRDAGSDAQRTRALITLVKASPGEAAHVALLAQQLADSGFVNSSLVWFSLATQLSQGAGIDAFPLYRDWAAELFIANELFSADSLTDQLLQMDSDAADLWFLRLLIDRESGLKQPLDNSLSSARSALLQRLVEVRKLAGIEAAAADDVPDLAEDLALLREEDASSELKAAYASAVADLLWLELYFGAPSPTTDRLLTFLRQILPEENSTLARLEGWNFLLRDRADEARVKLRAVSERDPLAALGLLRLSDRDDVAMQEMTRRGRQLLTQNPAGIVGAFISGELRRYGVRIELPPELTEMEGEIRRFTREWPRIYSEPGTFYVIRGEPLQVAHRLGEPILARIEIRNLSEYPLSIGPDGAIQPDLWFDARLQGVVTQDLSGIAYDTLLQSMVLLPKQSVSQVVRLDYSGLNNVLSPHPSVSFQVTFSVLTNPRTFGTEQGSTVAPGPVGQRVPFLRIIERVAMPLLGEDERNWNRVIEDLQGVRPEVKMDRIDLLRANVQQIRESDPSPDMQRAEAEFLMQINRRIDDETPHVASWARHVAAMLAPTEQKAELLRQMRTDDGWINKLLSLAAVYNDPALAADVAGKLTGEAHPDIVRRFARATNDAIEQTRQAEQAAPPQAPANR